MKWLPLPVFHWNCSFQEHWWLQIDKFKWQLWVVFLELFVQFNSVESSPFDIMLSSLEFSGISLLPFSYFYVWFLIIFLDSFFLNISSYSISSALDRLILLYNTLWIISSASRASIFISFELFSVSIRNVFFKITHLGYSGFSKSIYVVINITIVVVFNVLIECHL